MIVINRQYYDKWTKIWEAQSDVFLDFTAFVRAVECTNGCIQYAFRDQIPEALPLEQTRECMKLSMGVMKNKKVPLTSKHTLIIPEWVHPLMDQSRDIYIRAFKQNDDEAYEEFMALSKSHFVVMGKERMDDSFEDVRKYFRDLFTDYWIDAGKDYVYNLGGFT